MANLNPDTKNNPELARARGKLKKGVKHKSTIVKEQLEIKEIEDLKGTVLKNFNELSNDTDKKMRAFASKEIAKYIFPQKRQFEGKFEGNINIKFTY